MSQQKQLKDDCVPLKRNLPEVPQGARSFHEGVHVDDCPYRNGDNRRVSWMTGWYDERMKHEFGHIFRRHKITWP